MNFGENQASGILKNLLHLEKNNRKASQRSSEMEFEFSEEINSPPMIKRVQLSLTQTTTHLPGQIPFSSTGNNQMNQVQERELLNSDRVITPEHPSTKEKKNCDHVIDEVREERVNGVTKPQRSEGLSCEYWDTQKKNGDIREYSDE